MKTTLTPCTRDQYSTNESDVSYSFFPGNAGKATDRLHAKPVDVVQRQRLWSCVIWALTFCLLLISLNGLVHLGNDIGHQLEDFHHRVRPLLAVR